MRVLKAEVDAFRCTVGIQGVKHWHSTVSTSRLLAIAASTMNSDLKLKFHYNIIVIRLKVCY